MTNIVQTWAWFGLATLTKGADWVTRQDNEMIRLGSDNKIIRWKAISNGPFLYCHWRQEASQGWDLQELINIFACLKRGLYWQGIILLSRSCVKPFFELSFEIFCAFQKMPLPLLFHPLLETLWIRLTLGLTVKATVSTRAHNLSCDHLMGGARSSKELRYPSFEVPITLGFFQIKIIRNKTCWLGIKYSHMIAWFWTSWLAAFEGTFNFIFISEQLSMFGSKYKHLKSYGKGKITTLGVPVSKLKDTDNTQNSLLCQFEGWITQKSGIIVTASMILMTGGNSKVSFGGPWIFT